MQLNLKNPLVFFDLETTGIDIVKDRIVEISFMKVHPNGKEESKTRRINPGRHYAASKREQDSRKAGFGIFKYRKGAARFIGTHGADQTSSPPASSQSA